MSDPKNSDALAVASIPVGARRGWEIVAHYAGRSDVMEPGVMTARQATLGVTINYGMTPGGFDGFVISQDCGGVVIVPFVEIEGQLYIGVVEQKRPLQQSGGMVLNVPRGFSDGDAFEDEARRELKEEMGINPELFIGLGGQPTNPNSTFFQTTEAKQGDRWFGVALVPDQVIQVDGIWRLRPDLVVGNRAHRIAESIGRARFITVNQAVDLSDMFTVAAVAKIQMLVKILKDQLK